MENELKYSKKQFEGYTHRFIIEFKIDNDWRNDIKIEIFTNTDSFDELSKFIDAKKSNKVLSFEITHRSSKEQDEISSKLLDDFFNDDLFKVNN